MYNFKSSKTMWVSQKLEFRLIFEGIRMNFYMIPTIIKKAIVKYSVNALVLLILVSLKNLEKINT